MEITHEQRQTQYIKFTVESEATDKLHVTAICTNCPLEFRGCQRTINSQKGKIFAMVNLSSSSVENARKANAKPNCGVLIP